MNCVATLLRPASRNRDSAWAQIALLRAAARAPEGRCCAEQRCQQLSPVHTPPLRNWWLALAFVASQTALFNVGHAGRALPKPTHSQQTSQAGSSQCQHTHEASSLPEPTAPRPGARHAGCGDKAPGCVFAPRRQALGVRSHRRSLEMTPAKSCQAQQQGAGEAQQQGRCWTTAASQMLSASVFFFAQSASHCRSDVSPSTEESRESAGIARQLESPKCESSAPP